ncbi:response regulator transcription factor [Winogradskyella forsetii]|uniref:response regulator transcription factor n=1 Tax=Winogradskyella forsetii TaxID=2686077 RepID=UPI0015BA564E|nr:helix-turn-helix transcriptional regulator [Winogradskyella forsetii]
MELTKTENKVAKLVTLGYSEKQVADLLCVSPKTIGNHKYNIFRKNNLNNTADLVREYILSKKNPKKFFAALICLLIQLFAVFTISTQNVRRAPRLAKNITHYRVYKTESC